MEIFFLIAGLMIGSLLEEHKDKINPPQQQEQQVGEDRFRTSAEQPVLVVQASPE